MESKPQVKPDIKRDFVTFFDSNYLPKALVTADSLAAHHSNFRLYACCFDDLSYQVVNELGNPNLIPIHQDEFEPDDLKATKHLKRKYYEYYWAFKPHLIKTIMDRTNADMVTYMDCDFRFFNSPEVIFEEMGNADVLIQPNNFSYDEVDQFKPVGYYCSCFESFKNNENGRQVLDWWHEQCVSWCFAEFEQDKFADQKYLDRWRQQFPGVREIALPGANVAPWNIQKYDISQQEDQVLLNDKYPLIYYHYHSFRMNLDDYSHVITGDRDNHYRIPDSAIVPIYEPYIKNMRSAIERLKQIPAYRRYTEQNPKSNVHLISDSTEVSFSSYKDSLD